MLAALGKQTAPRCKSCPSLQPFSGQRYLGTPAGSCSLERKGGHVVLSTEVRTLATVCRQACCGKGKVVLHRGGGPQMIVFATMTPGPYSGMDSLIS